MLCCLSPRLAKASAADCIDPDQETHLDVWTTLNSLKSGCDCINKRDAPRPVYKSHEDSNGSHKWRPFDHQRKQMGKTPAPFRQLVLAKNSRRSANRQTQTCDNDRTDVRRDEATFPAGARLANRCPLAAASAVRTFYAAVETLPHRADDALAGQQYTQLAGLSRGMVSAATAEGPRP